MIQQNIIIYKVIKCLKIKIPNNYNSYYFTLSQQQKRIINLSFLDNKNIMVYILLRCFAPILDEWHNPINASVTS